LEIKHLLARIPYPVKVAIPSSLVIKFLIFSLGFVVTWLNQGPSSPLSIVMNQFYRWDSPHYIDIAKNWYVNVGEQRLFIVFFPLYPALIKLTTFDYQYINLSALLISNVSSLVAIVYLFKLTNIDFGDSISRRAVLYLNIFPTAYFLCAIYTEGLFLAAVIACFYYARMGKWPLAGLLGMFSSLTRINGLILLPALAIEYLRQKEWKLKRSDANLVWTGLPLVGFLIYLGINYQVTGGFFTFMEIERTHWHQSIDPLLGLTSAWQWATTAPFPNSVTAGSAQIVFAVLGFLAVVGGFLLRFRLSYNVYMLLTWMVSVSTGWWISVPRYIMTMFPLFMLLGVFGQRKRFDRAVLIVFSAFLFFFTTLFSMGWWTF